MFPILLISKNSKVTEKYLNNFIKFNKFVSYNISRYQPDPNIIKIDHIREIKSMLIRAETDKKLIIIYSFDTAKAETQNAFLKTLEEKNDQVQFIIVVGDETQVLSTISSRCKTIKLKSPLPAEAPLTWEKAGQLSQPLPQLLSDYSNTNKEKAIKICDQFLWHFRKFNPPPVGWQNNLSHPTGEIKILKEILKVRNLILKNNLNPQMAIDHLLIFINNCYNRYNDYKNYKKGVG